MPCLESQTPGLESQLHPACMEDVVAHMLLVKHSCFPTSQDLGENLASEEMFGDLTLGLPWRWAVLLIGLLTKRWLCMEFHKKVHLSRWQNHNLPRCVVFLCVYHCLDIFLKNRLKKKQSWIWNLLSLLERGGQNSVLVVWFWVVHNPVFLSMPLSSSSIFLFSGLSLFSDLWPLSHGAELLMCVCVALLFHAVLSHTLV